MEYTFDMFTVSDLYKDAYGFRPSREWTMKFNSMSDLDKQNEWNYLCSVMVESMNEERNSESRAYDAWMNRINDIKETNGISLSDAIRWDMQDMECEGDIGYYCFQLGVSYYIEPEIKQILEKSA
jgi:hypothetical protein